MFHYEIFNFLDFLLFTATMLDLSGFNGDPVLVGLRFFINAYFLFLLIRLWFIGCKVFLIEINPNDYVETDWSVDPEI